MGSSFLINSLQKTLTRLRMSKKITTFAPELCKIELNIPIRYEFNRNHYEVIWQ